MAQDKFGRNLIFKMSSEPLLNCCLAGHKFYITNLFSQNWKTMLLCFWFSMLLLRSPYLMNILAGYRILGYKSASRSVVEKSNAIPYLIPLHTACFCFVFPFHFSFLEAFSIFFLFIIFWNFTIICLDVGLFLTCCVSMWWIQTRKLIISVLRILFLCYFLKDCCLPCVFSFWNSYSLDVEYPKWVLQFSFLSFQCSTCLFFHFIFWEVSSCPNVLFKRNFWSVTFSFQ